MTLSGLHHVMIADQSRPRKEELRQSLVLDYGIGGVYIGGPPDLLKPGNAKVQGLEVWAPNMGPCALKRDEEGF